MIIWQECVKKENKHLKVYENFTINPNRCKLIGEIIIASAHHPRETEQQHHVVEAAEKDRSCFDAIQ